MIPNPWLILGVVLAFAASNWYSYVTGGEHKENEIAAKANTERAALIENANKNAVIDMGAAADAERDRQKARQKSLENRHALELDIERRATAAAKTDAKGCPVARSCDLDDGSFGLLIDAVRTANGAPPGGTGLLPGGVPASTGAGGRPGGDDPALGAGSDRRAPGVPGKPR